MKSENIELIETERRMVGTRANCERNGNILAKECKFSVIKLISSKDLMYSIMIELTSILYLNIAMRIDF